MDAEKRIRSETTYAYPDGSPAPAPPLCLRPYVDQQGVTHPEIRCELSKTHDGGCQYSTIREFGRNNRPPRVKTYRWPKA
jgi:hypothetical protein